MERKDNESRYGQPGMNGGCGEGAECALAYDTWDDDVEGWMFKVELEENSYIQETRFQYTDCLLC